MDKSLPFGAIDLGQYDLEELLKDCIANLNCGEPFSYDQRLVVREILMRIWKEREFSLHKKKGRRPGKLRQNVMLLAYNVLVEVEGNNMGVQDAIQKYSATPSRDSTLENAYYDLKKFYENNFSGDLEKLKLVVRLSSLYS